MKANAERFAANRMVFLFSVPTQDPKDFFLGLSHLILGQPRVDHQVAGAAAGAVHRDFLYALLRHCAFELETLAAYQEQGHNVTEIDLPLLGLSFEPMKALLK